MIIMNNITETVIISLMKFKKNLFLWVHANFRFMHDTMAWFCC